MDTLIVLWYFVATKCITHILTQTTNQTMRSCFELSTNLNTQPKLEMSGNSDVKENLNLLQKN